MYGLLKHAGSMVGETPQKHKLSICYSMHPTQKLQQIDNCLFGF